MPIQKTKMAPRKQIADGEHIVKVIDVGFGPSSKGDKMITVTFTNASGETIKDYFVTKYPFMMDKLADLKAHLGLTKESGAENMLEKKCGVLIGAKPANDQGHIYKEIQGYGKVSDVGGAKVSPKEEHEESFDQDDEIPF